MGCKLHLQMWGVTVGVGGRVGGGAGWSRVGGRGGVRGVVGSLLIARL